MMNAALLSTRDSSNYNISTRGTVDSRMSTSALASMLIGASLAELVILRLGTRTAIHIPGIEAVRGPYQVVAATGRLAFTVALLLLAVLLGRLARDLHGDRMSHLSGCILVFIGAALLSGVGLIGNGVLAAITTSVVIILAVGTVGRLGHHIGAAIALFALAFAVAATTRVLQDETASLSTETFGWLILRSEELGVLAAIASGPLVRRGLGLRWMPSAKLACAGLGTAVAIAGATLANPSTAHILMLWNFGLTGSLPAAAYGVAGASLLIAVASAARHGHEMIAWALSLMTLGGLGLISTYQSGLVIAGLAVAAGAGRERTELAMSTQR